MVDPAELQRLKEVLVPAALEEAGQFFITHPGLNSPLPASEDLGHHINNGLTPISGGLSLVLTDKKMGAEIAELITDGIKGFPTHVRAPLQEREAHLEAMYSDPQERAEAKRHMEAVAKYRDMLRDHKDALVAQVMALTDHGPNPPAAGRVQ